MDFLKTYKGKKVLITGHTGFKGGWLSIWLEMLGAEVYGYALDSLHENGIYLSSGISNRMNDRRGDIRDLEKLLIVFREVRPDVVFHLAAQALVIESYNNPVETFEINIQGTVNVLEAIRQTNSVKAAVMITTDKCYENKEWLWGYRETEPMGGHDPYSASKGAAELVISSYRRSFFNEKGNSAIASARAGNVIGGGDWASNRLVPDIFRSIEKNEEIIIRNPFSTRPWQHVLEPLGAYLLLGSKLMNNPVNYSEAWNFGPYSHEIHPVKDVVESIINYAGKGSWKDRSNSNQLHEANILMLDISKANNKLQWFPVLDFQETIRFTTDWHMNSKLVNVLEFSQNQIIDYQRKWNLRKEN